MAKVISLLKISGTIGDLTIRQTQSGGVAGLKPGPSREQVLTSDRFDRTRRNAGDFKQVTKDATLLRRALGTAIDGVRLPLLSGNMNKLLHRVMAQDNHHNCGFRQTATGDISLLAGFEFNNQLPLDNALPVQFEHRLDAATGALQVAIPTFIARRKKEFPPGATHLRITSCGAVVDFVHGCYANNIKTSDFLPLGKKTPDTICLEHRQKAASGEVLLHVMGIEFYTIINGTPALLKGGAMRILEVIKMEPALQELTPAQEVEVKVTPYTARDLHAIISWPPKQAPGKINASPPAGDGIACCHDTLMPLLPDIASDTNPSDRMN